MALTKKSSNNFQEIATELKKDIITSVGSMFEELKGEVQTIKGKLGSMATKESLSALAEKVATKEDLSLLDERLTWQITELRKEVRSDLSLKGMVENHEERLKKLERI